VNEYGIAWVAVKFGINTTSVALKMDKISRSINCCNFSYIGSRVLNPMTDFYSIMIIAL